MKIENLTHVLKHEKGIKISKPNKIFWRKNQKGCVRSKICLRKKENCTKGCLREELNLRKKKLLFFGLLKEDEEKNCMLTYIWIIWFILCEEDYVLKLRKTQIEAASMKKWNILSLFLSLCLSLSLSLTHIKKKDNGTRWKRKNQNLFIYY